MQLTRGEAQRPEEGLEFYYGTKDPIPLTDLAGSFAALDRIYASSTRGEERLAVVELRSGSVVATVAPFLPFMAQALPVLADAMTVADFARRIKKVINAFAEIETKGDDSVADPIASEIAAVMKPLAGRKGASFKFSRVSYRSKSGSRTVEVVAEYGAEEIDRAAINAERYARLMSQRPALDVPPEERNFVKGVAMVMHQANRGPAKARGTTGDRGMIEAVSDRPVPVYFAEGITRLKDRMVRSTKNPLRYVYVVDAWVHRENGLVKAYTVTEVHSASPLNADRRADRG